MQGQIPRYEFTLHIEKDGRTALDVTLGARAMPSEIANTIDALRKLLDAFASTAFPVNASIEFNTEAQVEEPGKAVEWQLQRPTRLEPIQEDGKLHVTTYPVEKVGGSDAEDGVPPTEAQEPENATAPISEPAPYTTQDRRPYSRPDSYSGNAYLFCKGCGRGFGIFLRGQRTEIFCKQGHQIPLTDLARFRYKCPCCEKLRSGWTNSQDASIELTCTCGNPITLTWNKKAREYRD